MIILLHKVIGELLDSIFIFALNIQTFKCGVAYIELIKL